MPTNLECLGTGAVCSVLLRFLHPKRTINAAVVNPVVHERKEGLIALRLEEKVVRRTKQICVVFNHEDFVGEVYCVKRYTKVVTPSPVDSRFVPMIEPVQESDGDEDEGEGIEMPSTRGTVDETTRNVRAAGLDVDDDNDPAPENIPQAHQAAGNVTINSSWGWNGLCDRKLAKVTNSKPKIVFQFSPCS